MSPDSAVELRFTYSREDYIAGMRAHERLPKPKRGLLYGIAVNLLFVSSLVALFIVSIIGTLKFQDWLVFALVVGFILLQIISFVRRRFAVSTILFERERGWRGERFWRISDEGIEIRSPTAESKVVWQLFDKVIESGSVYLFLEGKDYAANWRFLPKRVFNSMEEEMRFRKLIRKNTAFVAQNDGLGTRD